MHELAALTSRIEWVLAEMDPKEKKSRLPVLFVSIPMCNQDSPEKDPIIVAAVLVAV